MAAGVVGRHSAIEAPAWYRWQIQDVHVGRLWHSLFRSAGRISAAVRAMFIYRGHLRMEDPGSVEGNVVFTYLDAFDEVEAAVADLKAHYRREDFAHRI